MEPANYHNEEERNVHVWASRKDEEKLLIIAGCYTFDQLQINTFYKWLNMIILHADDSLLLFRCEDPRGLAYQNIDVFTPKGDPLQRNSNDVLPEGHYMLFEKRHNNYISIVPQLRQNHILSRTRTRSQTASPSGNHTPGTPKTPGSRRNYRTRQAVRRRDLCCCVTGQEAVKRPRGANFTSLEVAHIWPLAFAGSEALNDLSDGVKGLLKDRNAADQPRNAFLLRADLHAFYDDYQFGIMDKKIYRFEKSGASVVANMQGPIQMNTLSPDCVDVRLHNEHFRTCLLWHVRGPGRPIKSSAIFLK